MSTRFSSGISSGKCASSDALELAGKAEGLGAPLHERVTGVVGPSIYLPAFTPARPAKKRTSPHTGRRYLVADCADALYVACMGTKQRRDLVTNANIMLEPLWEAEPRGADDSGASLEVPAAHRGFLSRAQAIPIERLYQHARAQGKRLVLCGEGTDPSRHSPVRIICVHAFVPVFIHPSICTLSCVPGCQ
jgi:hypothetical protein